MLLHEFNRSSDVFHSKQDGCERSFGKYVVLISPANAVRGSFKRIAQRIQISVVTRYAASATVPRFRLRGAGWAWRIRLPSWSPWTRCSTKRSRIVNACQEV